MEHAQSIEIRRRELLQQRYANELKFLKDNPPNRDFLVAAYNDRISKLQELHAKVIMVKHETPRTLEEHLSETVKQVYKKEWSRIPPFHRIVKVREYIATVVKQEKLRAMILDELERYLNESQLRTKKSIVYDTKLMKITSMPCLTYDPIAETYSIDI